MTGFGRQHLVVLACLLVTGVFALDLTVPEDADISLLYVVVLLIGLWTPGARDVLYVAGFATLLSGVEYLASPAEHHWTVNVSNHVLQVVVVWITAIGVNLHRRTLLGRERAEQQVRAADVRLREQAALAQIGKMAAVVAHEVRNPLAGIRGAVQMIARRLAADAPEQRIAKEVVTRIDTLNEIVQDLLMFARPHQPAPVRTALYPLVQTTVALMRDDPAVAEVAVEITADGAMVVVDPELMKLALHNLLVNSAQAMEGRGRIAIVARATDRLCEIRIADEGPGISAAVRQHLFEPFFTTKHRGTGLGLATSRRLLEAHGGTLELICPPGGGTTAILRIPQPAATAA
jgi:signal transduction histidine kinase